MTGRGSGVLVGGPDYGHAGTRPQHPCGVFVTGLKTHPSLTPRLGVPFVEEAEEVAGVDGAVVVPVGKDVGVEPRSERGGHIFGIDDAVLVKVGPADGESLELCLVASKVPVRTLLERADDGFEIGLELSDEGDLKDEFSIALPVVRTTVAIERNSQVAVAEEMPVFMLDSIENIVRANANSKPIGHEIVAD